MFDLSKELLDYVKAAYRPGTRIVLNKDLDDPHPIFSGAKGTVNFVDDAGQLHVSWDNGRSLALIYGVDSFSKIW